MTFRALRRRLGEYLIGDVPAEMAACIDCDTAQCRDDRYLTCPVRLTQWQAALAGYLPACCGEEAISAPKTSRRPQSSPPQQRTSD